jgi:CHRD domain.
MKNALLFLAALLMIGFYACEKSIDESNLRGASVQNELKAYDSVRVYPSVVRNFRVHLTGSQETPANESAAIGQAVFMLSANGNELNYRLIVANISDVIQSHIHIANVGENGAVVVWLYPTAPPSILIPGRFSGVLQTGVITKANLVGALKGKELSALITLIDEGRAYVNVHTLAYPGGEIRGQIFGSKVRE